MDLGQETSVSYLVGVFFQKFCWKTAFLKHSVLLYQWFLRCRCLPFTRKTAKCLTEGMNDRSANQIEMNPQLDLQHPFIPQRVSLALLQGGALLHLLLVDDPCRASSYPLNVRYFLARSVSQETIFILSKTASMLEIFLRHGSVSFTPWDEVHLFIAGSFMVSYIS